MVLGQGLARCLQKVIGRHFFIYPPPWLSVRGGRIILARGGEGHLCLKPKEAAHREALCVDPEHSLMLLICSLLPSPWVRGL